MHRNAEHCNVKQRASAIGNSGLCGSFFLWGQNNIGFIVTKSDEKSTQRAIRDKPDKCNFELAQVMCETIRKGVIHDLIRDGCIEISGREKRKNSIGQMQPLNLYRITAKGMARLHRVDSHGLPKVKKPKPPKVAKDSKQKQDVNPRKPGFVVPSIFSHIELPGSHAVKTSLDPQPLPNPLPPNVKVTVGICAPYEVYKPPAPTGRDYTPRKLPSILSSYKHLV